MVPNIKMILLPDLLSSVKRHRRGIPHFSHICFLVVSRNFSNFMFFFFLFLPFQAFCRLRCKFSDMILSLHLSHCLSAPVSQTDVSLIEFFTLLLFFSSLFPCYIYSFVQLFIFPSLCLLHTGIRFFI